MVYASNSPVDVTVLRLQARKSLALGIQITDSRNRGYDITESELRLVIRKRVSEGTLDDSDNLITSSLAEAVEPSVGYAKFKIQASELNHKPGEYLFSIVLSEEGYSSTIVSGVVQLEQNTEFTSIEETYTDNAATSTLRVVLENQTALRVIAGHTRGPGESTFLDSDKRKLDSLAQSDWNIDDMSKPGAIKNRPLEDLVPIPFAPGEVLTSHGAGRGDFDWARHEQLGYEMVEDPNDPGFFIIQKIEQPFEDLPAHGVAMGAVPMANGADGWGWQIIEVPEDLDDIPDTATRFAMTVAQRDAIQDIVDGGSSITWENLPGKPDFGTAAQADSDDFLPSTGIPASATTSGVFNKARIPSVSQLNGFAHGTGTPSGPPGTIYLKHA